MAYAAAHPDGVDRLLLISSGGPTAEFQQWFGDSIEARLRPEDIEARAYWVAAAKRGLDPDEGHLENIRAVSPAYFFDRAKGLASPRNSKTATCTRMRCTLLWTDMSKGYDSRAGLQKLNRPVLIVQGHQDPIGQKTAEDIHGLIRGSTLRYISRCGHFPWVEQPEAFRKIVAEFLGSEAAAR